MKCEWVTYTVQQLIDMGMIEPPMDGNHGAIHPKTKDYVAKGMPFIMANDLVNGKINYHSCAFIKESQAATLRKGFAKPGDVLLTHKATIGRTAIVSDEYDTIILTPQVTYYRVIKGLNRRYLKYYFDSNAFQYLLSNWAGAGSTRAYLGITAQRKLPIIVPPIEIQDAIADICGSLDDKIELNNKINENLERQARALYQDLFINYADPEWKKGTISDLGTVIGGSTPSKSKPEYYTEKGIAWITPKDLSLNKAKFISRGVNDITELGLKNSSASIMPEGTVLFSSRAPIGYIAIATGNVTTNQGFKSVIPKPEIGTAFVYYFLKFNLPIIEGMASGSTFKEVSANTMKNVPAFIPDPDTLVRFNNFCKPIFAQQQNLEEQNHSLAVLRDSLLPKLISGEIDISQR